MIRKTLSIKSSYTLARGVTVYTDAEGEVTVFDAFHGRYWRGNTSAKLILTLLEQAVTIESICLSLQEQYNVSHELSFTDAQAVLSELYTGKLIRKVKK